MPINHALIGTLLRALMGALIGSTVAVQFLESDSSLAIPMTLLAGTLGGVVWAGLAALLKVHFNVIS